MSHPFATKPEITGASKIKTPFQSAPTKLRVGKPSDACEQEAGRVADQVMCQDVRETARFASASESSGPDYAPPIVEEILNSTGEPLESANRSFFEQRFGRDLSRVRIHFDSRAAESARAMNASAYTVGHHVVFAPSNYAPASKSGQHLLAHELAHVVQQRSRPMLQRQPQDQASENTRVGPLVQKFLKGQATPEEKATLRKQLLAGQLSPAEVEALQNYLQEDFRTALGKALAPLAGQKGQINITVGGPVKDVHKFFKAKLRVRLSGAAKTLASGFEGTVETIVEVNGDNEKKTVTVTITPPLGDTSLAALIRAKAFPNGPLSLRLGENYLKALSMISLQGEINVIVTGSKGAASGGLVISSPDLPEGVELDLTLSESAERPQLAPTAGSPALPSPRAFVTGGLVTEPKRTGAAVTAGVDLPLFTDTKNPLIYGGVGLRAGADTQGNLTAGGAYLTGIHLSPVTLQLALEAGIARSPGAQTGTDSGSKTSAFYGAEASASIQVLKHVQVIALASAIGGKDLPASESLQIGAAFTF
jgi:hypothetical protein